MTVRLTRIRCEGCGNTDPARFTRTYFERAEEKLVGGRWTAVRSTEAYDGADTLTACEVCGAVGPDEDYRDVPDHGYHGPTALVTDALASLVAGHATPTPLTLLEYEPSRGHVALSTPDPSGPERPHLTLRLEVLREP